MTQGRSACTWCGVPVDADQGFRCSEPAGARVATFCRLEHIVAWALKGARWEPASGDLPVPGPGECALCAEELPDTRVVLVRSRGEARVTDEFCGVEHLLQWARAGGRYARW